MKERSPQSDAVSGESTQLATRGVESDGRSMTRRVRLVVTVACLIAVSMLLFPPWVRTLDFKRSSVHHRSRTAIGYHFIGYPPSAAPSDESPLAPAYGVSTDITRLVFQLLVLALLTVAVLSVLQGMKASKKPQSNGGKP